MAVRRGVGATADFSLAVVLVVALLVDENVAVSPMVIATFGR
jgi:hypothetical protein